MAEAALSHVSEQNEGSKPVGVGAQTQQARLLTWNINGLRKVAASHGGLKPLLDQFQMDIVEHDLASAQGYHCFFTHCKVKRKPSYSGVATFVRSDSGLRTLACTTSLRDAQFFGTPGSIAGELNAERLVEIDAEGRVLVTDHGHVVLFNVYAPCVRRWRFLLKSGTARDAEEVSPASRHDASSSSDDDERTDERSLFKRDFLALLEFRIAQMRERGRDVILVGDLNACASQLDHGYAMSDSEFFSSKWSKWIRGLLELDSSDPPRLVDCFRRLHPDRKNAFTCWNTKTGARENNYGTRIDYIIANTNLSDRALRSCDIMPEILGSDHCPVRVDFVVPLHTRSAERNGSDRRSDELGNDYYSAVGSKAPEVHEHPPECSCFYRELTGKQEKLARYFVAGATQGKAALSDDRMKAMGGARARTGWVGISTNFGGARTSSRNELDVPSLQKPPSKRTNRNVPGRAPSVGKAEKGRETGSIGGRQSKLMFESNSRVFESAMVNTGASTTGLSSHKEIPTPMAERHKASPVQGLAQGMHSDEGRGSNMPTAVSTGWGAGSGSSSSSRREQAGLGGAGSGSGDGSSRDGDSGRDRSIRKGLFVDGAYGNPENSAQAWKALFGQKKNAPLCEHGEPSIQRTVLKQGANHNRRFYTCARSAGNWPTDRNARCGFFQWRMDGVRGYKDRPPREEKSKKLRRS